MGQTWSVAAQDVSATSAARGPENARGLEKTEAAGTTLGGAGGPAAAGGSTGRYELEFEQTQFDTLKEGYVELRWTDLREETAYGGEVQYVVEDNHGDVVYRGPRPRAFVSGLSDGDYAYRVTAYGPEGKLLGRSDKTADVTVAHWPLEQALALFFVGLVIFVAVVSTITWGAIRTRSSGLSGGSSSPPASAGRSTSSARPVSTNS